MDYYQGVVTDCLRADRTVLLNTECCIQLNEAPNPNSSGPHWYCDAVAADSRSEAIFLCEISYAREECVSHAVPGIRKLLEARESQDTMPVPRNTMLEMVAPRKYVPWNRLGEKEKPGVIPEAMRI
jgi:hypothetical protein